MTHPVNLKEVNLPQFCKTKLTQTPHVYQRTFYQFTPTDEPKLVQLKISLSIAKRDQVKNSKEHNSFHSCYHTTFIVNCLSHRT